MSSNLVNVVVATNNRNIDTATISWSLPVSSLFDGAPAVGYSYHDAEGDTIVSPTSPDIISKVAADQRLMFEPPVISTIVFVAQSLSGGQSQNITFAGYDAGPSYNIAFGGINHSASLVHRCAKLLFINTSIYKTSEALYAKAVTKLKEISSPAELIYEVTKLMLEDFDAYLDAPPVDLSQESIALLRRIHRDNTRLINEEWFPVLTNEESKKAGIKSFGKVMGIYSASSAAFKAIKQIYESNNSDFSSVITQLETMFQIRFIPSMDGLTAGKFISFSAATDAEPLVKPVAIRSLSVSGGPKKFLPLTGVVIKGLPGEKLYAQATEQEGKNAASWPESLPENGQLLVLQAPPWIPFDLKPDTIPSDGTTLSIAQNQALVDAASDNIKGDAESITEAAKEIARMYYNDVSLRASSATVVTTLDLNWEIGKRYLVLAEPSAADAGGPPAPLFNGFLRKIEHRVSSNPSSLEATTQLTFSHVEVNGFTLPNK